RLEALSTTFSTAIDQSIEALPALPGLSNSLNLKEFLVPITLEVGRIIRGFETPSRLNFRKLKYNRLPAHLAPGPDNCALYCTPASPRSRIATHK
ncbi:MULTISPECIES: hypothetical protein, partial [unclassified Pseudomonas]|uniref:hypothetical protein n=1 Tax=unclassified Pseudomonas TaxID=196821 RepID=UPI00382F8088